MKISTMLFITLVISVAASVIARYCFAWHEGGSVAAVMTMGYFILRALENK